MRSNQFLWVVGLEDSEMSSSIPRKFSQVLDDAREETEMQQLYTELDEARGQLDDEIAKNLALRRAKERAESEVKTLRAGGRGSSEALQVEVQRLQDENVLLRKQKQAAESELKEAKREIEHRSLSSVP